MTKSADNTQLRIKSYFAATVAAAGEQASRELGPDALLVEQREAPPEAAHLGKYEVVFGLNPGPAPDPLRNEMKELRRQMDELRASFQGSQAAPVPHDAADLHSFLRDREIDDELAAVITRALHKRSGPSRGRTSTAALWDLLPSEMESRFTVDATLPIDQDKAGAVALIGPPGAGKTTTLVKLAINFGMRARRPVQVISMDNVRIGAGEQLRALSAILGVGFQALETARALEQALEEHQHKGLILIDTAGYSAAGMSEAQELAQLLRGHERIDTHLVLPASMKPADMNRTLQRFEIFRPAKLLFTRVDETESYGAMFCASARSGLPISFLASGQSIPEDLEPATKARLMDCILPQQDRRAESAA